MNINNNNVFISLKKMNNKKAKYKTMLCKNFESPSGCSYNEKCQFAHGVTELKSFGSMQDPMMFNNAMGYNFNVSNQPIEQVAMKKLPNPQNYKIVKCKNFEMGNCKYKNLCTFAHGEAELRTKNENSFYNVNQTDNNMSLNNQSNNMNYMQMYNQYNMPVQDVNAFQQMYNNNPNWNAEMSQMYNFQNIPPHLLQQGGENMMINPNNINLNNNMMGIDPSTMDPNMFNFFQQQQQVNRNTQN